MIHQQKGKPQQVSCTSMNGYWQVKGQCVDKSEEDKENDQNKQNSNTKLSSTIILTKKCVSGVIEDDFNKIAKQYVLEGDRLRLKSVRYGDGCLNSGDKVQKEGRAGGESGQQNEELSRKEVIKLEYLEKSGVLTKQEEKTLADYRLRNGIVAKNVKKECVVGQDYGYGQSQEQYHQQPMQQYEYDYSHEQEHYPTRPQSQYQPQLQYLHQPQSTHYPPQPQSKQHPQQPQPGQYHPSIQHYPQSTYPQQPYPYQPHNYPPTPSYKPHNSHHHIPPNQYK